MNDGLHVFLDLILFGVSYFFFPTSNQKWRVNDIPKKEEKVNAIKEIRIDYSLKIYKKLRITESRVQE